MIPTIEFSKKEIKYAIWVLRRESENPVIAGVLGKLLDTLKVMGAKVRIISPASIQELEEKLMEAVERKAELEERIKTLESERSSLLAEIEALKAIPKLEAKVSMLESEVTKLREEKKGIEEKIVPPAAKEEEPV